METLSMFALLVGAIYGPFVFLSFIASCFFRTFLVVPMLTYAGVLHRVGSWKDSLKWGFYVGWEFLVAVILLIPYMLLFRVVYFLLRINLAKISFWNAKEQRFLSSTPRTLFKWWVSEYFARYYPNKEFPQEHTHEPLR